MYPCQKRLKERSFVTQSCANLAKYGALEVNTLHLDCIVTGESRHLSFTDYLDRYRGDNDEVLMAYRDEFCKATCRYLKDEEDEPVPVPPMEDSPY